MLAPASETHLAADDIIDAYSPDDPAAAESAAPGADPSEASDSATLQRSLGQLSPEARPQFIVFDSERPDLDLQITCMLGSVDDVRAALEKRAPLDASEDKGYSLVHQSVVGNKAEVLQLLLEAKASVVAPPGSELEQKNPPLLHAVDTANTACLKLLLEAGASPMQPCAIEKQNGRQTPVLEGACQILVSQDQDEPDRIARRIECLQALFCNLPDQPGLEQVNMSLLNQACINGSPNVATMLLEHGVDPNGSSQESHGLMDVERPLIAACTAGKSECVRLLLDAFADPALPSCIDKSGTRTAFLAARESRNADCVRLLVDSLKVGQSLVGKVVEILKSRTNQSLAGRRGTVLDFDMKEGVCRVSVGGTRGEQRRTMKIPPAALRLADTTQSVSPTPSSVNH